MGKKTGKMIVAIKNIQIEDVFKKIKGSLRGV